MMMEGIPVSPETFPYLVSGSGRRMLWVRQPRERLSVAFRHEETLEEVFSWVVESIEKEGLKRDWGNVLPFSEDSIIQAFSHLAYYGIKPAEVFFSDQGPILVEGEEVLSEDGTVNKVSRVPWLPPGYGIVVPENKTFLGSAIFLAEGCFAVVVHNPSRGMVVLRDLPEENEEGTKNGPAPQDLESEVG